MKQQPIITSVYELRQIHLLPSFKALVVKQVNELYLNSDHYFKIM